MAAPANSRESDMATEDFCLNLSPLPSLRWSPLCFPPSPPRPFLPSSSSMVMQYQGSNQSMDNPPQNQEHDDMVDPEPYLAGDSALLQQLRQNWSEASDWGPGGGIMKMNNQGFEESIMGFEEESEELMMTYFYFPPSPTNFPLYRPMPSVYFVSSEQENISLALSCQHILEDKSGAWHVINDDMINDDMLPLFDGFMSYLENKWGIPAGLVHEDMESLVDKIMEMDIDEIEATIRRINWLEQHDEDIVDQPVIEVVGVADQLIQNRDGELDVIFGGGVFTVNGLEYCSDGQGSPATPETLHICQANISFRVWLGHGGQWATEIRMTCNRLNTGSFTTVEDAISAYEIVVRWSGWEDLTFFPGLFENENRSKLSPQLSQTAQEKKRGEDFGLVRCNATGNDEIEAARIGSEGTGDCVMADQAWLNSGCLGKRKTKEKNQGGERRNKKTNGVRIAIPLEDILQTKGMRLKDAANHLEVSRSTLKRACREYNIKRWPPRKEHELINQTRATESPAIVDQEQIPQLNSDTVLPPNQPRKEHELISQTCPNESLAVVDQEQAPQLKSDTVLPSNQVSAFPNESPAVVDQEQIPQLNSNKVLPSTQVSATIDTKSVKLKARYEEVTIAFRLSRPFLKVELEQEVKKRLSLEAGTYNINYKDEDDDLILISCDEDLEECISSSSPLGSRCHELFLKPK